MDDARFESKVNRENRENLLHESELSRGDNINTYITSVRSLKNVLIENSVSEDDEFSFLPEDSLSVGENGRLLVALIIGLREEMVTLSRTLKTIQVNFERKCEFFMNLQVTHISCY